MKAWYTAFSNGIATLVAFVGIGMMLVTGAKYPRLWQWAAAIFWAKLPLSVASASRSSFLTKALLIATALLDMAVVGFCLYQAYASRDLPTANVLITALALVAMLVFARGVLSLIMAMLPSVGAADKFDAEWPDQQ